MAQQQLIRMNGIFNAVIITIAILSQVSESAAVSPGVQPPVSEGAAAIPDAKPTGCKGVTCPIGKECVVDKQGFPSCVCSTICPEFCLQICGSDGVTYCNQCQMNRTACNSNIIISVEYNGMCEKSCSDVTCPSGKECVINTQERPSCVCSTICPLYCLQFCGSDGVTYCNPCLMNRTACESNTVITEAYAGQCVQKQDPCAAVRCAEGSSCQVNKKNHARCVCDKFCGDIYQPVCGSDGKTYGNECELYRKLCQKKNLLKIVCHGECKKGRKGRKPKCINGDATKILAD